MTDIFICAVRELRVKNTIYTFADKFPFDEHVAKGDFEERVGQFVKDSAQIVPLTRYNFDHTIIHRANGTIPRGFTEAELIERGILDGPAPGAAPTPKAPKKANSVKEAIKKLDGLEPIEHNGYLILPVKQGNFTRFEAQTKDGVTLRESRFMKADGARAFIDGLAKPPEPDTSDQSGSGQEQSHDGNF